MAIQGKERSEELEQIYSTMTGMRDVLAGNPDYRWFNAFLKCSLEYLDNFALSLDKKKIPVLYNVSQTPELFHALGDDVYSFAQESFFIFHAVTGAHHYINNAIDVSFAHGLAPDVCSTNKSSIGYQLQNLHPVPACAVYYSSPCDNEALSADNFKSALSCPVFVVDVPHNSGKEEIEYVAAQMKHEIAFLEEHTGRKMSWERLRRVCEETNKMSEKIYQWSQLRKTVPCPQSGKFASFTMGQLCLFGGTAAGTFLAAENVEELKERIARGAPAVADEKFRVAWFGNPVSFDGTFYDFMEQEMNMVIPMDLFGYYACDWFIDTSTPASMLEGLARRTLDVIPMMRHGKGSSEAFIGDWLRTITEYKCNCAIFGGHVACKSIWGSLGLAKEMLRKLGIPLLVLEYDYLDNRVTPIEEIKEELRRFRNDVLLPRLG